MSSSAETSRRAMLLGAAGGVAALMAQALGRPAPVDAEDEAIVVGGEYTTATSRTFISNNANNNTVIEGASLGNGIAVNGTSATGIGLRGLGGSNGVIGLSTGGAPGNGVWGRSIGGTFGVLGESTTNIGVGGIGLVYGGQFTGSTAQVRLLPAATVGRPTSGAHQKGEMYVDSKANLFLCTADGTPGTWKKVLTKLV